jgi:hypothetical protein
MINYGSGAGKDGAVTNPRWGPFPWADKARVDNIGNPSPDRAHEGVEPLDTYPAKWFNYFGNYYSDQLIKLVEFLNDIYAELIAVGGGVTPPEAPNKNTPAQLLSWITKIAESKAGSASAYITKSKVLFQKAAQFAQIQSNTTAEELFGILATWYDVITGLKATGLIPNQNGAPANIPPDGFGYLWVDTPTNTVRCKAMINGVLTEIPMSGGGGGKTYDPNDVIFQRYDKATNKITWTVPPEVDISNILVIYVTGQVYALARDAIEHTVDKTVFDNYPLVPKAIIQIKDLDGYCSPGQVVEMAWQ